MLDVQVSVGLVWVIRHAVVRHRERELGDADVGKLRRRQVIKDVLRLVTPVVAERVFLKQALGQDAKQLPVG